MFRLEEINGKFNEVVAMKFNTIDYIITNMMEFILEDKANAKLLHNQILELSKLVHFNRQSHRSVQKQRIDASPTKEKQYTYLKSWASNNAIVKKNVFSEHCSSYELPPVIRSRVLSETAKPMKHVSRWEEEEDKEYPLHINSTNISTKKKATQDLYSHSSARMDDEQYGYENEVEFNAYNNVDYASLRLIENNQPKIMYPVWRADFVEASNKIQVTKAVSRNKTSCKASHLNENFRNVRECRYCSKKFFCCRNVIAHGKVFHAKHPDYKSEYLSPFLWRKSISKFKHLKSFENYKSIANQSFEYASIPYDQIKKVYDQPKGVWRQNNYQSSLILDNKTQTKSIIAPGTKKNKGFLKTNITNDVITTTKFKGKNCDYTPNAKASLSQHSKSIHSNVPPFICIKCEYTSAHKGNLAYHIRSKHLLIKDYHCKQCDYSASLNTGLKRHIKAVHNSIKDYRCGQCDYSASQNTTIKLHINAVHNNIKDFQCEQCDYSASKNTQLEGHIKVVHNNTKDHQCEQCDYSASQNTNLNSHIKAVHDKIKDYQCEQCEYSASANTTLKMHIKEVHNNIKDIQCEQCDYRTSRNTN